MRATPGRFASAVAAVAVCAAAAAAGASTMATPSVSLSVHQVLRGRVLYIEGSRSFVRVTRPNGVAITRRLDQKQRAEFTLRPGRYRISSWQRPCDGNCGVVGPPTDRCSRAFAAPRGARLHATVSLYPGAGCRIAISRSK